MAAPSPQPLLASRLPVDQRRAGRGTEVAVGTAGAAALLALLVGVPVCLVALAGNPLPETAPRVGWLADPLTARTVVKLVGFLIWLLWLNFCVCVVVEVVTDLRGRGLPPRVAGGGIGTQPLAARVVGAVMMLRRATTVPRVAAGPVQRRSATAPEPAEDGSAPTSAAQNMPGTTEPRQGAVEAESTAAKYYEVQPAEGRNFDTLWDIAERFLGNGLRYREIFGLNAGVLQPDGRKLVSAELLHSGWLLRLPDDAEGRGLQMVEHPGAGVAHVSPAVAATSSTSPATASGVTLGTTGAAAAPAVVLATTGRPMLRPVTEPASRSLVFGAAGGLIAAAMLSELRRRRTSGSWLRPRGPFLPAGNGTAGSSGVWAETALRAEADPSAAAFLRVGLRAAVPKAGAALPTLRNAVLSEDSLRLIFSSAPTNALPAPWAAGPDPRVWTLARYAARRLFGDDPPALREVAAPYPAALVTIGRRDDDSLVLTDLESLGGLIAIGGDETVARAVAMSWAVDHAVHPWADRRSVVLGGFAEAPVAATGPALRLVDDVDHVLAAVEHSADRRAEACRRLDVRDVHLARQVAQDAELWASSLIVCSGVPAAETLERLQRLAARIDSGVSVVVVGNCPQAQVRLVASAEGRLWNAPLGLDVRAQQLSVDACRELGELFAESLGAQSLGGGADRADELAAVAALAPATPIQQVLANGLEDAVVLSVLGPVELEADGPVDEGQRELLTELVLRVAVARDGLSSQQLSDALWPYGVVDEVRDESLVAAQRWLGLDADGDARLGMVDGRWVVRRTGVRFDWDVFTAHVAAAVEAARDDRSEGGEEVGALRAALDCVRGEPWTQLPPGRYSWLAGERADTDAVVAVVLVARRLAALCALGGDGRGARDAVLGGLTAAPACEDLWRDALRLAARLGSRADVRAVADSMYDAIAASGAVAAISAETAALVEELLPGHRRRPA